MTGTTPVPLTCWGNNSDGQTGGPVSAAQPAAAVPAFDATDVQVLAAGGRNTCVVANGVLQCIGANDVGQLGRGSSDILAHATFANVATLPPSVSAVAIGTSHMCAVVGGAAGQPGPVSCWGQNQNGQLGDGLDVELGYASEPDATKRIRTAPVFVAAPRTL